MRFTKERSFTVCMSLLCSVIATEQLITILLNPGAKERIELFVYAIFLYISVFYYFFIRSTFKLINLKNAFFINISILWFYFILFRILQGVISGSNISFYELFSQFLFFYVGCTFAESVDKRDWILFLIFTFLISTCIILYFCYSIYQSNAYSLAGIMYMPYLSPQHEFNLIQSTELSNHCAHIFIIGMILIIYRKLLINYKMFVLPICIITLILILFICFLFSVGTLVGLLIILLCLFLRKQTFIRISTLIITIVAFSIFNERIQFFKDLFYYKLSETDRRFFYSMLINQISENPVWGMGRGRFFDIYGYYPHHNFLGTWAEGGIFLLLFYSTLIILIIIIFFRLRKYILHKNDKLVISIAFSILFFWHFKGLFQDTWNNSNIYFWTGIIAGVYIKYKNVKNILRRHCPKRLK